MATKTSQPKIQHYTFDAQGQKLGRFASTIALHLQGKMEPSFTSNKLPNVTVTIKNIDALDISDKKLTGHVVKRFTGYHGGLKTKSWNELYTGNPAAFFMRVLKYMLPKNKQAVKLLKYLKFE